MRPNARLLALLVTVAGPTSASLLVGCGGGTSIEARGTGGAPAGHPDSDTATGGASSTGGSSGTGGQEATGGASVGGTGGGIGIGGNPESGGRPGTGGAAMAPDGGTAGVDGHRDAGSADAAADRGSGDGAGGAGGSGPAPGGKITVWLAGDSTMMPCTGACPCGWGTQFQPLFNSNVTVVNGADGGRSIQTWLYDNVGSAMSNGECTVNPKTYSSRWQRVLDGMKAGDYLFVEFGINDANTTCNRHVGTALFQDYLGVMAQAAKQRGAQAVFLTSTNQLICTGSQVNPNRAFGPETMAAATANNVPLIDLTKLTADFFTSLGFCPGPLDFNSTTSPEGKFFCTDHTHFEPAGAAQIAGVVAKALRDQNIPLAAYLK